MTDVAPFAYDDSEDDEADFQPRPRRRAHALTWMLGAALLIAAGFLGGVLLQKHEDHGTTTAATTTRTGAAARFAGLAGGTGATGTGAGTGAAARGGFGGGGAVTGTVKLVDGANVYVTDATGNVVKILTTGGSQLTKTDPAKITDVAPGDVVIVRGAQNTDGSYTAQSLVIGTAATGASAGG